MKQYLKISKISPFITTANLGDYIIADYCDEILSGMFGDYMSVYIPSREKISKIGSKAIFSSDFTFVCGTNLLSSNMLRYKAWEIGLSTPLKIATDVIPKNKLYDLKRIKRNLSKINFILLGVGWWSYQGAPTLYTKTVLKKVLDNKHLHSVRDSYTECKLKELGIDNVINTACPTMWSLTKYLCAQIPAKKQDKVLTTITDYRKNKERDTNLLECLLNAYKDVYIWLQSYEDLLYLESLGYADRVHIIPPTLKKNDEFLANNETDYIGTRLHAGIRALNNRRRSCIIGIDNRAIEISKDTNLPVIRSDDIELSLNEWIYSEQPTIINLPTENIAKWKSQFVRQEINDRE